MLTRRSRPDDGRPLRSHTSSWADIGGETLISLTRDYPYEQLAQKQLEKMGVVCKRGQTVNGLDTQLGLVEAGLGVAVIPSFGVMASRNRKVRVSKLEPEVTLDFYEVSNREGSCHPKRLNSQHFSRHFSLERSPNSSDSLRLTTISRLSLVPTGRFD